jgi:hypothetical protein
MYFPLSKPKLHTYIRGQWRMWWDSTSKAKSPQASIFLSSITAYTVFCYMLMENTSLKKTVIQTGIGRHPAAKPVTTLQFCNI